MLDLAIRNGTVITAGATFVGDVGVESGRVVSLGRVEAARQEVDATGLQVLPGGVDVHTHLDGQPDPDGPRSADDFYSGTVAAACGGVTTVVDYAWQYPGYTLAQAVGDWQRRAAGKAVIDYSFHVVVSDFSQATLDEVPRMIEAGYPSFKVFMMDVHDRDALKLLRATGAHGGLAMMHCENGDVLDDTRDQLTRAGHHTPRFWAEARPELAEAEATGRAIDYCEYTGAPIYVVHLSCAPALERVRAGKARHLPVWLETRPCYLLLSRERYQDPDPKHLWYTGWPPLREREDVEALWQAAREGLLDTVGSDHSAWTVEQKRLGTEDLAAAPVGLPGIEGQTRAIYSEGVSAGRISVNRFVEIMSTTPARLLGLYPRKGTIAPGSDADFVLMNPRRTDVIRFEGMHSACGYEPCEGLRCTGWPVMTISRGEIIAREGAFLGQPGRGQLLQRQRFDALA